MKIVPMQDGEIKNHLYKLSTSPEGYEFKPEDGTLTRNYSFVDIKALARAAQANAFRQVVDTLANIVDNPSTYFENQVARLDVFLTYLKSALYELEKELSK